MVGLSSLLTLGMRECVRILFLHLLRHKFCNNTECVCEREKQKKYVCISVFRYLFMGEHLCCCVCFKLIFIIRFYSLAHALIHNVAVKALTLKILFFFPFQIIVVVIVNVFSYNLPVSY